MHAENSPQVPPSVQRDRHAMMISKVLMRSARYVALVMVVLGAGGLAESSQTQMDGEAVYVLFAVMLVVGLATLCGLKSPKAGIVSAMCSLLGSVAAILNLLVTAGGVYLVVTSLQAEIPELRRILGMFCLIGGALNVAAFLLTSRRPIAAGLNAILSAVGIGFVAISGESESAKAVWILILGVICMVSGGAGLFIVTRRQVATAPPTF